MQITQYKLKMPKEMPGVSGISQNGLCNALQLGKWAYLV